YPQSYRSLMAIWPLDQLSTRHEIMWAGARLEDAVRQIRFYVFQRDFLSDALLSARYQDALNTLDEIEAHLGKSIWGLKLRLATLQRAEGLDAQKRFLAEAVGPAKALAPVRYIAYRVSTRNESAMSSVSFRNSCTKDLAEPWASENLKVFVRTHLVP